LFGGNVASKYGKYQVLKQIGEGGFGVVYLAEDTLIGDKVALKVSFAAEEYRRSLLKEAGLLRRLNHENIVRVFEADMADDALYIAMEYLPGGSLKDLIAGGKMNTGDAIKVIGQVLRGLAYAHGQKILHRDVKPANVLFDDSGRAKLTDFGVARMMERTAASTRIGTVPYMAPEQLEGRATFTSDIYAAGVMLYEMLTGRRAFDGDTDYIIMRKISAGDFERPRKLNPKIPKWLEDVVIKAMAVDAEKRYRSVKEMAADLAEGGRRGAAPEEAPAKPKAPEPAKTRPVEAKPAKGVKPIILDEAPAKPRTVPPVKKKSGAGLGLLGFGAVGGAAVLGLLVVAALGVAVFDPFGWWGEETVDTSELTVPFIVGKDYTTASAILEENGFVYTRAGGYDPGVPEGSVISLAPAPGATVPEGTPITVTVCDPSAAKVPDVVGRAAGEADRIIGECGYEVGKTRKEYSDTVAKGLVIAQDPPAGTGYRAGGEVSYTISLGKKSSGGGGGGDIQAYKVCPDCGTVNKKSAKVCKKCGHLF
jgi:predicted Ser/Thr protein kinase